MNTQQIADLVNGQLVGDGSVQIERVADRSTASAGEIAFIAGSDHTETVTAASCLLVPLDFAAATSVPIIRVKDPKLAFTRIASVLHPRLELAGWHPTANFERTDAIRAEYIGEYVSIGEGSAVGDLSRIHAGVRLGRNVTVGVSTEIFPNCVIYDNVTIGSGCVVHAGSVIGSPGFGYVRDENGEHHQFPQIGTVVIEDKVEIGAGCCIDRGALGETRIGAGSKFDNLVHIAHNVSIGKRVIIAGQSGIAGSSVIGDDVVIAGQVGIADHVRIEPGAVIGAKSAVFPNKVLGKGYWSGIPVQPVDEYRKQHAHIKSIGRLKEEVRALRNQVAGSARNGVPGEDSSE